MHTTADKGRYRSLNARLVLLSVPVAVVLHYVLTPAESDGSSFARLIRLLLVLACAGIVMMTTLNHRGGQIFALYAMGICCWIMLLNFPPTSWYVLLFLCFVGASMFVSKAFVSARTRDIFMTALDLLLCVWILAFLAQFFLYYAFDAVVDFHSILHPYSEARIMGALPESLFRLTGVHIEPGTHANWVYGAVLLRAVSRRKLFDYFNMLAVTSVVLTYSFWGTLAAAIFLLGALISSFQSFKFSTMLKLAIVMLACYGVAAWFNPTIVTDMTAYLANRADLDDGSGQDKLLAYSGFIDEIWGVLLIGAPIIFDYCNGCQSPEDAGIFVNLAVRIGLVATVFIFLIIARALYQIGGIGGVLALAPLMFTKYVYFEPIFWMIFGVCLLNGIAARAPVYRQTLERNLSKKNVRPLANITDSSY